MFVIGKRDLDADAVSVRVHGKGNLGAKPVRKRLPKFYRRSKRGVLEKSVVDENLIRDPFILFVSFFDFLLADDVKFSVLIESDRKLNPRVTCAAAEN